MVARMLARSLAFVFAVVGVGCVATADTSEEELGTTSQALYFPPIVLFPSWNTKCPVGAYPSDATSTKFFVRRASRCDSVVRTTGTWVGTRMFGDEKSGFCRYAWSSTSSTSPLPTNSDYWALDPMGQLPSDVSTTDDGIDPRIIPDCQKYPTCTGTGISCPAPDDGANRICYPDGSCTYLGSKIVNPCGSCGVINRGVVNVVVPYDWRNSGVSVEPWTTTVYGAPGVQAYQVVPPYGGWWYTDGTGLRLGVAATVR